VTVRNSGRAEVTGWTVSWATPAGTSIDDLWNGRLVRTGATAAIANAEWNAVLKPGESTTFGFIALARGGNRGMPVTDCRPGE
jgi:cellulase/cellobiase CelA1